MKPPLARLLALFAVAAAAAGGHAAAQSADAHWFAIVDATFTRPSVDLEYALQIDTSGFPIDSTRHLLDSESGFSFRAGFGREFGSGRGSMRVTYWSFDANDTTEANLRGRVEPLVFGAGYYGAYYYLENLSGVETTAESEVEASIVDLDYRREITEGPRFRVSWLAGLRVANYDESQTFRGDDATLYIIEQEKQISSDAYGVRVGADAQFRFGRIFSLEGDLSVSSMLADIETEAVQRIMDPGGTLLFAESAEAIDDSAVGLITDVGARGVWEAGRAEIILGILFSHWNGIAEDRLPPVPRGTAREDVSFNSAYLGLRWRFTPKP